MSAIQSEVLTRAIQTVYNALKAGYRLLDGAGDYGNEKEAGEGLARAIKDGIVKREEVCEYFKFGPAFRALMSSRAQSSLPRFVGMQCETPQFS